MLVKHHVNSVSIYVYHHWMDFAGGFGLRRHFRRQDDFVVFISGEVRQRQSAARVQIKIRNA